MKESIVNSLCLCMIFPVQVSNSGDILQLLSLRMCSSVWFCVCCSAWMLWRPCWAVWQTMRWRAAHNHRPFAQILPSESCRGKQSQARSMIFDWVVLVYMIMCPYCSCWINCLYASVRYCFLIKLYEVALLQQQLRKMHGCDDNNCMAVFWISYAQWLSFWLSFY